MALVAVVLLLGKGSDSGAAPEGSIGVTRGLMSVGETIARMSAEVTLALMAVGVTRGLMSVGETIARMSAGVALALMVVWLTLALMSVGVTRVLMSVGVTLAQMSVAQRSSTCTVPARHRCA
jgi:hypothetical protein